MVPAEPGEAFGTLGGVLDEHRKVLGSTWRVPGELLADPGGVLGAGSGGFGSDWGEQPLKKWPGPIGLTVLETKKVPKVNPRGAIFRVKNDAKSHGFFNVILRAILGAPGHPLRQKSSIFIGVLFKIEGRPFCAQAPPRLILGAIFAPKRNPKS